MQSQTQAQKLRVPSNRVVDIASPPRPTRVSTGAVAVANPRGNKKYASTSAAYIDASAAHIDVS